MIVLLVVCTVAFLAGIGFILLRWQRRRYQNCTWASKLFILIFKKSIDLLI